MDKRSVSSKYDDKFGHNIFDVTKQYRVTRISDYIEPVDADLNKTCPHLRKKKKALGTNKLSDR